MFWDTYRDWNSGIICQLSGKEERAQNRSVRPRWRCCSTKTPKALGDHQTKAQYHSVTPQKEGVMAKKGGEPNQIFGRLTPPPPPEKIIFSNAKKGGHPSNSLLLGALKYSLWTRVLWREGCVGGMWGGLSLPKTPFK